MNYIVLYYDILCNINGIIFGSKGVPSLSSKKVYGDAKDKTRSVYQKTCKITGAVIF